MSVLRLGLAAAVVASALLAPGAGAWGSAPPAEGRPSITISVPGEVEGGVSAIASGRVARAPRHSRIILQARQGGAWRSIVGKRARNGAYRIAFVLPKGSGAARMRSLLLEGGRRLAASSVRGVRMRVEAATETSVGIPAASLQAPLPEDVPPPGDPPSDNVFWGAWIGDQLTGAEAPWDMGAVSEFEQLTGKPLSMLEFSSPFADCSTSPCSFYPFPSAPFEDIRAHGAIPFFSWGSESIPGSATEPDFQLSDLIAGTYDSYIRSFADQARAWGHPFFLRFDWEMNGSWFPWGKGVNGNNPGEYVTAWRHVHDIFTSAGATNATWVWCPYVNQTATYESLYPGDRYVDWTCLDGYNWGINPAAPYGWKTFDELFAAPYHQITEVLAPSKPMVLAETAASEYGGSKADWIHNMFDVLGAEYPQIRGLIWFEKHGNGMDWPLESSESALGAFKAGVGNDRYLGNTLGGLETSPIPAP